MNTALLQAGRAAASALLCFLPVLAFAAPFTFIRSASRTLTPAALAAAEKIPTAGTVSPDGKTLTFTQKTVRLVAVTGPENDMLSYRMDGLRNPTLVVPKGAVLTVLFVNTDDDMAHNIRFGPPLTAYPTVMEAYVKASAGTPELAPRSSLLHADELILRVPDAPGVYAYLCTVRGHAQGGMAGKLVVQAAAPHASMTMPGAENPMPATPQKPVPSANMPGMCREICRA